MQILVSNDDGVKAQGINVLFKELDKEFDVTVVAPDQERSSCGHAITLDKALRINKVSHNIYECSGKPADCTLIGIGHLFKNKKLDLVVSGINHGANLGQDRFYSGTMAAAREAIFRGVPAISSSLVFKNSETEYHFDSAAKFIRLFVKSKLWNILPAMHLININIPNLPWAEISGVGYGKTGFQLYSEEVIQREDVKGRDYFWVGGTHQGYSIIPGSDCDLVNRGFISITVENLLENTEFAGKDKSRFVEEIGKLFNDKDKLSCNIPSS